MQPGTPQYYAVSPLPATYTMLDLFAGAGGLSLGLHWAGFRSIGAVECDTDATATYEVNFGDFVERDSHGRPLPVEEVCFKQYRGKVDLLVGGPPCQGFSQLGKRIESDPRNRMWQEFVRAVEEVSPRGFLMENVPPILKSEEGRLTSLRCRQLGYNVVSGVLSAERYGVPQKRKRAFIIGIKDREFEFPDPNPPGSEFTVRRALAGLPLKPNDENWHVGRNPTRISQERYACVPEGGNRFHLMAVRPDITPRCWLQKTKGSTDVFGRLWWDRPALTIRTEFYKPEKGRYLHPSEDRPITHREAARLQSFPDTFDFMGSKISVALQIGNAVPPVLAYRLGLKIREAWENSREMVKQLSLFTATL